MPLNSDKPDRWRDDIAASLRVFDAWFLSHAPKTFRAERQNAAESVKRAFAATDDFTNLTPAVLEANPAVVSVLRMATTPPLARDRLIGLSAAPKSVVQCLEDGRLPPKALRSGILATALESICAVIVPLLDLELFPWRTQGRAATVDERSLAAFVIADRLCTSLSNPIIRNAHQVRQRKILSDLLIQAGYVEETHGTDLPINFMKPGTFSFGMNVRTEAAIVAVDLVVQPKQPTGTRTPIMIELKAAGDFTNVNKRRKEESEKFRNLKDHGRDVRLVLFLCGYFDVNYLQYEAGAGIDWFWEHRPEELLQLLT